MKLIEIINLANAYNSLMNVALPRPWKLAIKANIAKMRPVLDAFEAERKDVMARYGADAAAVGAELEPLLETEHPIELSKMPASEMLDSFTLGQEIALAPMIEE